MNLVKKGSVLLAALSVLALTGCGGKKTLTLKEATEWLKDADVTKAKTAKIASETFKWDISVTGTGMEPNTEKGLTGAVQFLIAYLVTKDAEVSLSDLLKKDEFKSLNNSYVESTMKGKTADEVGMSFFDAEDFTEILLDWSDCYCHQIYTQNDLLYVTFNRREVAPGNEIIIDFTQEIAIKKDGFLDHYSVKADKTEFKGKINMGDIKIEADGTFSGDITATFQYQE